MDIATLLGWVAVMYLVVGLVGGGVKAATQADQRTAGFKMMARAVVAFVVLSVAAYVARDFAI